jgi:hypothetical protein
VASLEHRATRLVDQRPDVVHARLLQLAARLRDEMPPVEPGTQAASMLGISGPVGVEIVDKGPNRIELRTSQGRIRAEAAADLAPTPDGRTNLTLAMAVQPQGFAANMMLGVALKTMPNVERQVVEGIEATLTDLATELAKPDSDWDPAAWKPPTLQR